MTASNFLVTWRRHGAVEVRCSEGRGWQEPNHHVDPQGLVAWSGWPLSTTPGWDSAAGLRAVAASRASDRFDHLRGTYAAVVVDAHGTGAVFGDPMGLRPVYWGRNAEGVVAGSDPRSVAEALATPGTSPARDPLGTCALGAVAYRPPLRTGFEGVAMLAPGASLRLGHGAPEVADPGPPWLAHDDLASLDPTDLLAIIHAEITAGIEALLRLGSPTVELTGGKDSRLVLAELLRLGVAHDLPFETSGPPGLGDVVVAEQLAEAYRLRHERVFRSANVDQLTYAQLFDRFVAATTGMVSAWETRPVNPATGELRISGLNGEALRTHLAIPADASPEACERVIERALPSSALGLARPELTNALEVAFGAALDEARQAGGARPHDVIDTLLIAYQTRQQYGPLDEIQSARRFLPLYAPRAIRAAFALGGPLRHAELVHHELIRMADPSLAAARFATGAWSADLARFAPVAAPPSDEHPKPASSAPTPAPQPLMATLHHELAPDRRAVLEDLLADSANPAWDLLERTRTAEAVADYGNLKPKQRKELFGAATAAAWLAG